MTQKQADLDTLNGIAIFYKETIKRMFQQDSQYFLRKKVDNALDRLEECRMWLELSLRDSNESKTRNSL